MWTNTSETSSTKTTFINTFSDITGKGRRDLQNGRVNKTALALIAAALCLLLFGCQEAVVQTFDVALATPSLAPEPITLKDEESAKYGITVLSPFGGTLQEDGTVLAESGERISVLATQEPTAPPIITPTPVPTAPPETPTPTPSPTPTPTPVPTEAPDETATPKPTAKATAKPTAKPTNTPKPTATPSAESWGGDAPVQTPAITAAPTAAPVPTATPVQTSAQSAPNVSGAYSGEDVLLASRVAYFESGRSEEGYRAVACVILNRVESGKWPNSVHDVVYQKSQFSVVGRSDFLTKTIPDSVIGYVNDVLNKGNRLLPTNVMSFRSGTSDHIWGSRTYYGTFGGNDFYS